MDHCPGGTLSALLKREKTLKPQRAIEIARQLLSALELAHHQGILHRDIKPGNIVIGDDDRIQVLDFGLAKDVLHAGVDLARSKGRSLGTPLYMSPEHVRGEPSDPRTDLYAVGVVLYEMVCGRPPHYGGTAQAVMHGHLRIIPKPPSTHAYVSEAFDRVVLKALSKERRDRWQTAAEFAHALERLVQ
jgi:serine/threonine-protein kinase